METNKDHSLSAVYTRKVTDKFMINFLLCTVSTI